jgi:hypothetical protein
MVVANQVTWVIGEGERRVGRQRLKKFDDPVLSSNRFTALEGYFI